MTGTNGTGADTRLNSPQERAWLAGLAWLNGLTPAERDAALAAVAGPAGQPVEWTPAAKRVSLARDALFQAVQVADLLIGELDRDLHDETPLYLGLTVRVRELADAADLLLTDACEEEDAIPQASRTIFGPCYRPRATEGVAL